MATSTKKHTPAHTPPKFGKTVIYRGIKILRMTGKRSAIAEQIRDGLWATPRPLLRGKSTHR